MAGANSNIQISDLDFISIKNNLKNFLKSQDVLKDYNYEGSALSTLLDVLAFNTQYNAFYLNMVANEMFLDTAIRRESVVTHAKLLNYTPKSVLAPEAEIHIAFSSVLDADLTLPKNTPFLCEPIDGVNYKFVTVDDITVPTVNNVATFSNVTLKQGVLNTISFNYNPSVPNQLYTIPNSDVDTSTLLVTVQESSTNSATQIYTLADDLLSLDSSSQVYFLQESTEEQYQIYFGNGVLGKSLKDGNIIRVEYLTSKGTASEGANNFTLLNTVSGYGNYVITPVKPSQNGAEKETIDSIKFQAPKAFAAQKRAVTKEDYIVAIQNNTLGYPIGAVSVWGGEENDTPVYGQVFISLKPTGSYNFTETQKQRLVEEVIRPISVLTVNPTIVDPDYTYFQVSTNVLYDPKKTNLTTLQLSSKVKTAIQQYAANTLNTFNSTFMLGEFVNEVKDSDNSIITNEVSIKTQKKFYPKLNTSSTYKLFFGSPLERGLNNTNIMSSPGMTFLNGSTQIQNVFLEEVPATTVGVESISLMNPGYGYQTAPKVTILGDGTGATATASINAAGSITKIDITSKGSGYTSALVKIEPQSGDTTGKLGAGVAILEGRYGTLRTYYNNTSNVKTILNSNAGTIDYELGVITLNNFAPSNVNNDLGQLTITAKPTTSIISSSYNRIITLDDTDYNSIVVNVTPKTA